MGAVYIDLDYINMHKLRMSKRWQAASKETKPNNIEGSFGHMDLLVRQACWMQLHRKKPRVDAVA